MDGEQAPAWACFFMHRPHRLLPSVCVNDSTMRGKRNNLKPMWDKLVEKKKIQRNQRTFRMKSTWVARSVSVNQTMKIVEEYKNLLESLISVVGSNRHLVGRNRTQTSPLGPLAWKDTRRNAWHHTAKCKHQFGQFCKVSTPCVGDPQFKKKRNWKR